VLAMSEGAQWANLLAEYGWGVALIWLFVQSIWPTIRDALSAEHRAKLAREEEERRRKSEQEERMTKVMERLTDQLGQFSLTLNLALDRLSKIERDSDDMKESLSLIADRMGMQQKRGNG